MVENAAPAAGENLGEVAHRLAQRKFHSAGEFFRDLAKTVKLLLKKRKSISKMDPLFRESICLAVTFANDCAL